MRRSILIVLSVAAMGAAALSNAVPAHALGLKIAPLQYRTELKENEVKKGFVDVSNPTGSAVSVASSVMAFKQTDDSGALSFYSDEQITAGIRPDLSSFVLGPREALRMYFTIDGNKLPSGDVFAAVFLTTEPKQPKNGVGQSVRVGTLLSIVNKTPGERKAEVTGLDVSFFQLSDTITGSYSVKNTGSGAGGFYPSVMLEAAPLGSKKTSQSSLVFSGRQRQNDFSFKSGYGIRLVSASHGGSTKKQWVITVAPWMLLVALGIVIIVGIELLLNRRRRTSVKT